MSSIHFDSNPEGARKSPPKAWREPVVVVGLGCRLPGGIENTMDAWEAFSEGRDAFVPFSRSRLSATRDVSWGPYRIEDFAEGACLMDDIELFDPALFGISPREARYIDPQQRLLLLATWAALEDACVPPRSLAGARVGVFVGMSSGDYGHLVRSDDASSFADVYSGTGTHASMTAGRIAHCFGFSGPALVVDTACSSSLVAVHIACQSLLGGECDWAIVGGAQLLIDPRSLLLRGILKALSPDGRCKPFSERANGFGMGEGVVVAVLKREQDALRDGDRIDAMIRGTAVGHNGGGTGLTVPNRDAQIRVLRQALEVADVEPDSVEYLEAHGTGTELGDPIEITALAEIYGDRKKPLFVGSAKSNFGHLEAAAGILSVMKVVLSMQAGIIPRSLHATPLSSHVRWSELPLKPAEQKCDWPMEWARRRAGVSSFGMSGTNCHVVIEEGTGFEPDEIFSSEPHLIVLSADSDETLTRLAAAHWDYLAATPTPLYAFAAALACGRSHLSIRAAFVAHGIDDLMTGFASLAWSRPQPRVHLSGSPLPKRRDLPVLDVPVGTENCTRVGKAVSLLRKRIAELRTASTHQTHGRAEVLGGLTTLRGDATNDAWLTLRFADQDIPVPHEIVDDVDVELDTLARLYVAGAELNWSSLHGARVPKPRLPTYPFTLEPFWFDVRHRKPVDTGGDFL